MGPNETTLNECAEVVSRVELALDESLDDEFYQLLASELATGVSRVLAVGLRLEQPQGFLSLAHQGERLSYAAEIVASKEVTEHLQAAIEIWIAPDSSPHVKSCLEETAYALLRLFVSATARLQLSMSASAIRRVANIRDAGTVVPKPRFTMHRIAECIARTAPFDRVSLLSKMNGRHKFIASSVQSDFDSRAEFVVAICAAAGKLSDALGDQTETTVFASDSESVGGLHETLGSETLTVREFSEGRVLMLGERTSGREQQTALMPDTFWLMIERELEFERSRQSSRFAESLRSTLLGQSWWIRGAAAALLLASFLCPMTISVQAEGKLDPKSQRHVFAPATGIISRVAFRRGQSVNEGEVLCELSSHELRLREAEVVGELMTAKQQLAVAISRRGEGQRLNPATDRRVLEVRIGELEKQLNILKARKQQLVLRSPIDGVAEVALPDDSSSLSSGRPVETGQLLARVFRPHDGYQIELEIDDRDVGYVLEATRTSEVGCRFRLRANPENSHDAVLTRLSESAHVADDGRLVVRAILDPVHPVTETIAESGVVGWIDCRSAPAGFVLFRKVIETLRVQGWI